jgi:hypothetical protein
VDRTATSVSIAARGTPDPDGNAPDDRAGRPEAIESSDDVGQGCDLAGRFVHRRSPARRDQESLAS